MPINKVKYGNNTLIDLTDTTATASEVLSGYSFHDKTGALVQGSKTIDLTTVTVTPTNTTQVIVPGGNEYYLNIENMAPTSTSWGVVSGSNPGTFWNISWSTQLNAGEIYHVTLDFYRAGYERHYVYDDDITFNGFPFNITASSTSSSHNATIKFNTTQISNSLASDDDELTFNRLTVSVFKESTVIGFSQVTVNGDADLISSNIKKNVDIFGVVGTYEAGGSGGAYQDANGYVVLNDGGGGIAVVPLSVTENGTYTAPTNTGYSPVTVNVAGGATFGGTITITVAAPNTGGGNAYYLGQDGSWKNSSFINGSVITCYYPLSGAYYKIQGAVLMLLFPTTASGATVDCTGITSSSNKVKVAGNTNGYAFVGVYGSSSTNISATITI